MNTELSKLLEVMDFRAFKDDDYEKILEVRSKDLPADYLDFISTYNGAVGFLGEHRIFTNFWTVEEILMFNPYYKEDEFSQSVTLIGSNGSGTNLGYYPKEKLFFYTDQFMMNDREITRCGPTFLDLVRYLSSLKEQF